MSKPTMGLRKAGLAALSVTLTFGAGVAAAGTASALPGFEFERLPGDNRYDTAGMAADEYTDLVAAPVTDVIIANGTDGHYPDALAGNYLAGLENAPVLLTRADRIPPHTQAALERLNPQNVWIVGGEAVVPADIEAELAENYNVERLGGDNRYETTAAVIRHGGIAPSDTAVISTGLNFADSLAAGPMVYSENYPLGLTRADRVPSPIIEALQDAEVSQAIIVGGEGVVGAGARDDLEDAGITVIETLAGDDRAATSVEVAEYEIGTLEYTDDAVNVASGYNEGDGADALAGGPVTGEQERPLLITRSDTNVDDADNEILNFLADNCDSLAEGLIFGGTDAIDGASEAEMEEAAVCETNQDFGVNPGAGSTSSDGDGENQTITISGISVDTVDLRLTDCDQVTVGEDGTVTFNDDDATPNEADLDAADSSDIVSVDGVLGGFGDAANNVVVGDDDSVTVEVSRDAAGCARLVIFDGATNNVLELDANDAPTGDFAVSGRIVTTTPDDVEATPANATNPYGEQHTITAQLVDDPDDNAGTDNTEDSAEAGVAVRFSRYAGTCPPAAGATPVEVVNATTDANGAAAYSFSATDPSAAAGNNTTFCVVVQADLNNVAGIDAGDPSDTAQKTFSDAAPAAQTLELTPATDVNEVGSQHTVTATLTDQFGDPVSGAAIDFAVATGNQADGDIDPDLSTARTTNADGVATFTYSGPEDEASDDSRDDTITATYDFGNADAGDDLTANASKRWREGVATVDGVSYATLDEAIAAADAGDTITARGEFVDDDVRVNKNLTIVGDNAALAGGFQIAADDVTIRGFAVDADGATDVAVGDATSTGRAFVVHDGVTGYTITENEITDARTGVYVNSTGTDDGAVTNNTLTDVYVGIRAGGTGDLNIRGNTIEVEDTALEGVSFDNINADVSGNTFNGEENSVYVRFYTNPSNTVKNQILTSNTYNPAAELSADGSEIVEAD